jgi:hypothetical protein
MTTTGPADVVMAACAHAVAGPLVSARPGFRELVSVWPASGEPTVVRAVFPGSASVKPAVDRMTGRSRPRQPDPRPPASTQTHQTHQPHRAARAPGPSYPRSSPLANPLYLYLLERPAVALPGWSIDPGRDMLCLLTSPPRWLQSP